MLGELGGAEQRLLQSYMCIVNATGKKNEQNKNGSVLRKMRMLEL